MAIFTESVCLDWLNEASQISKIPAILNDIIKRIKELDKQFHTKYKDKCYYKINILSQDKIKENIADTCDDSFTFAKVEIINVNDNEKWKKLNLSNMEFMDYCLDRWDILNELMKQLQKEFPGYLDYEGDKHTADIFFINKDIE